LNAGLFVFGSADRTSVGKLLRKASELSLQASFRTLAQPQAPEFKVEPLQNTRAGSAQRLGDLTQLNHC
jgi:hypothetical protein